MSPHLRLPGSLLVLLVCCVGPSIDIRIPKAQVAQNISRRFPITQPYGDIAQVTLSDPGLVLDSTRNRLVIPMRVAVSPRGLGALELTRGELLVSSSIAFDNETGRFQLENVELDSIELDLGPLGTAAREGIYALIRRIMNERLEGTTFYSLDPKAAQPPLARLFIRSVDVRGESIVVTLGF